MTIFERIIAREIPAHIIYEDDACIAIMDNGPFYRGQVLIISKECNDYLFNIDDPQYSHLFAATKKLVHALDKAFDTIRTCMVVEGFEVPHAHIKLYPMKQTHLILKDRIKVTDEELAEDAEKIKKALV